MTDKQNSRPIRCRFAPSPTGYLHVGGARTALFNQLYARHHGGTVILRIEDTDLERSTPEATEAILHSLNWLKISWDEGPFYQTQRFDMYRDYAKQLLKSGHAYRCYCTAERLDAMREEQKQKGLKPQYDRTCRPADGSPQSDELPAPGDSRPFTIRLRVPAQGEIVFDDMILGEIRTSLTEIDDLVIVRSEGTPTYNFVVVVDDIDMRITDVIRGMDHVSNTPKQIVIYNAFGAPLPRFAHVPMILGPDKKKLSKRHGAVSVFEYKKEGYLADAFVNYIARLGWSFGDQELFTRDELEKCFSLDAVGKSPAVFDTTKLNWVNAEHMKLATAEDLYPEVVDLLVLAGVTNITGQDKAALLKLIDALKVRSKTLNEIVSGCRWYFTSETEFVIDSAAQSKHLTAAIKPVLTDLRTKLSVAEPFVESVLEPAFHQAVEAAGIKLGALAQPVRVAVTGGTVSPPIYSVLEVLGKDRSLSRLDQAIASIAG